MYDCHLVRALLFTGEEPLYLPRYLAPILERHADRLEAVVVALDSGATRLRRQGESRSAFDASDCP